ncbi:MAG: hypothetical protein ACR2RL_21490, partial [Gammaproteobacteria bacterium]
NLGLGTGAILDAGTGPNELVQRDNAGNIVDALNPNAVTPIASGGTGASTAPGARTALGLGSAATRNVGTAAGNLVALDGSGTLAATLVPSSLTPVTPTAVGGSLTNSAAWTMLQPAGAPAGARLAYAKVTLGADGGAPRFADNAGGNNPVGLTIGAGEYAMLWIPMDTQGRFWARPPHALGTTVQVFAYL